MRHCGALLTEPCHRDREFPKLLVLVGQKIHDPLVDRLAGITRCRGGLQTVADEVWSALFCEKFQDHWLPGGTTCPKRGCRKRSKVTALRRTNDLEGRFGGRGIIDGFQLGERLQSGLADNIV